MDEWGEERSDGWDRTGWNGMSRDDVGLDEIRMRRDGVE